MLGIPAEDRQKIFDWTNQMTGAEDADLAREDNDPEAAAAEVLMYSMGLAADRKAEPARRHRHQAGATPTRTAAG